MKDSPLRLPGMKESRAEAILIVEDDVATQNWLASALLAMPDVQVHCCATVSEAVSWLHSNGPDIVLTDLGLPDGSGIDVIECAVRLHPRSEVLVISIFGDEAHVVAAIEAGASGYLLKDSSFDNLGEQLQHLREGGKLVPEHTRHTAVNNYDIPYRSLLPQRVENLLVAVSTGEPGDDLVAGLDRHKSVSLVGF